MAATDCYPVSAPAHAVPNGGVAHAAHPHVAVHHVHHGVGVGGHGPLHAAGPHVAVPHLPVFGPPMPPVALNCVRTPGALPAGPGFASAPGAVGAPAASAAGTPYGALGRAFYDQGLGAAPALAPAAAGALGLAKAAMIAGTIAAATVGGAVMMTSNDTSTGTAVGMIYAVNTGSMDTGGPTSGTMTAPLDTTVMTGTPGGAGSGSGNGNGGGGPDSGNGNTTVAVPEPGTLFLYAFGAVAAFVVRQRSEAKRRSK